MMPTNRNSSEHWLFAAWVLALVSTLAVLFIGEVLGQTPCVLCWYQRAFMFPLAVILGIAVWRLDVNIWVYCLPLALIGAAIALWHLGLYYGLIAESIQPCTASGPSCIDEGMVILGLPIPLLSLGAFGTITACLLKLANGRKT
ncbi:disulfide bond formation protein B [Octadecabacter sp. SW4]|uniref:disulfide bond formation protein B n=1 Tax=Octadecabacter sp. SW4 TaxID=2602067 RepID=UPI0020C82812|nr:disulfide bond formation protein B [Octadecabacter sp. SW4]|tara:strand:+ start:1070 stop:1501 length:432 start_codon:yes stop_codon:yes gene_type:complete